MGFVDSYMVQVKEICDRLDMDRIAEMVAALRALRERGGRLFVLGVGGSAANAAHAVNDFRKLCNIEAYAPTDNVSELTARTNDEGWASVFEAWLRTSQLNDKDALLVFSYRESLRDIETCLSVHASKLYHMGFRQPVRRSTLADANERRDWRIHAALAQRLITQARTLYVDEELGLDLTNTVYALDSTTIALCLSVFPWAHFRTTKAAVKMHTLLDLRGNIPSFIHISDGKLHDVHALDMLLPEAGAIYVVDRGYVDFARLYVLHQAGAFFVTRAKSNIDAHRVYSAPTDRSTGIICDQTISLDGFYTRQDYPELLRRIRFKDPESGKTLVFITNNFSLPAATICALYKSRWQVELFFKWIKQHLRIKQFYGTSENAVKTQIWIAVSVYVLVAIVKKRLDLDASLYTLLQILSVTLFEKMPIHQALAGDENRCNASQITNQLNLFDF